MNMQFLLHRFSFFFSNFDLSTESHLLLPILLTNVKLDKYIDVVCFFVLHKTPINIISDNKIDR